MRASAASLVPATERTDMADMTKSGSTRRIGCASASLSLFAALESSLVTVGPVHPLLHAPFVVLLCRPGAPNARPMQANASQCALRCTQARLRIIASTVPFAFEPARDH